MIFFTKRLRYLSTDEAYRNLLYMGVIDESGSNTTNTIAVLDVPGGDYLVVLSEDIGFDAQYEVLYQNSIQEYIGGRPNDR